MKAPLPSSSSDGRGLCWHTCAAIWAATTTKPAMSRRRSSSACGRAGIGGAARSCFQLAVHDRQQSVPQPDARSRPPPSIGCCAGDRRRDRAEPGGKQPPRASRGADLAARLRKALAELPENQRAAVLLRRFEGSSYNDIAEILGLSPSAVDGLLTRARRTLEKKILSPPQETS